MDHELNQINVIPLVDGMFVLLVIILTTATFITTGQIQVSLAKTSTSGNRQDPAFVITVTSQGGLFVNDQFVGDEQLDSRINAYPHEPLVLIRADKDARLERFVSVVDRVRGLSFQRVSLEVISGM